MLHGIRVFILLFALCLFIVGNARAAEGSHTGAWYWQPNSGHGFNMEDLEDGTILVFWYLYRPDGTSTFLLGIAVKQPDGSYVATLQITGGMVFGEFDNDDLVQENWGTLKLSFTDCNTGTAEWTPTYPGYTSGSTPIQRLSNVAHTNCTESPFPGNYQLELFNDQGEIGIGRALLLPDGQFVYASLFGTELEIGRGTWSPTNGTQGQFTATGYSDSGVSSFDGDMNAETDGISGETNDGTDLNGTLVASFQNNLTMADMAGTWNIYDGLTETQLGQITFDAQGALTGTVLICTLSGTVSIPDSNFNQFAVTANYTGCGTGTLAGAGTMSNEELSALVVDAADESGLLLIMQRN